MELFFLKIGLGGFLLALLLSVFSFIVYFFRLAFLSIAVSHAVLAGIAIGVFFDINPTLTALIFSVFVGWIIAFLRKKTGLTEDASIGVVLAISLAAGVVLIYLSGYQGNILAYLFGSITTIDTFDNLLLTLFSFFSLIFLYLNREKILFLCFDEETAYSSGIGTEKLYYTIVALLSFLITFATKLVGIILTHAMLVIPSATAYQIFWHYGELLTFSAFVSLIATFGGLVLSYFTDIPAGPSIILLGGFLFLISVLVNILRRKLQ